MRNTKDRIGNKPIHTAAIYGYTDVIELLLKEETEFVHEINDRKETPLHLAVRYGHSPSAALLIENGASLAAVDNIDDPAFKAAQDLHDESLIAILQKYQFQGLFGEISGLGVESRHEFESVISSSWYRCYWNRSYLVGPYNVGKTTLAKSLVKDPIPEERRSTDGIWVYLGRAGMDIDNRKWFFIPQGTSLNSAVQSMLISSGIQEESKENNVNNEDSGKQFEVGNIGVLRQGKTQIQHYYFWQNPEPTTYKEVDTRETSSTPIQSTSRAENYINFPVMCQSDVPPPIPPRSSRGSLNIGTSTKISPTNDDILDLVLSAVKDGEYKMKLVPIDLWDFGGQKIYYMTHQLFISSRGIFIIIFNGSKDIRKECPDLSYLPGQYGTKTIAVYLLYWVNSILTYCKTSRAGYPKIMFVATHKDLINKAKVVKHKEKLISSIEDLFKDHSWRPHLQISPLFFVDARNNNDQELEELRKAIVELAFSHPRWGEPMPTVFVPLDLQLSEHAKTGQRIMSYVEIQDINAANKTMVLTPIQLVTFLKMQHALGKYIYFNEGQLNKYVVIEPTYLVEVLKSVVTEEEFWTEKDEIRTIYVSLRDTGILKKVDLLSLWGQEEYSHIINYKDYLINMLIHLDILIEPRSNLLVDREVEDDTKYYFVPCMVKQQVKRPKMKSNSSIHLAYAFKEDIIPPAFMYRFLGACVSMWDFKAMFTDCAIVVIDKYHELIVYAKGKRLIIELIHKESKKKITKSVASTVQESLTRAIIEISKFYWSATDSDSSTDLESIKMNTVEEFSCVNDHERTGKSKRIIPFSIELGVKCASKLCFLPHYLGTENWGCEHNKQHDTSELGLWFTNRGLQNDSKNCGLVCSYHCQGLVADELKQCPTDQQIGRLVYALNLDVVKELFHHLDMPTHKWDGLLSNEHWYNGHLKFFALWEWTQKVKEATFGDLKHALIHVKEDPHILCKVFKELEINFGGLTEEVLAFPLDEFLLENLSNNIGNDNLLLGVELGLSGVEL